MMRTLFAGAILLVCAQFSSALRDEKPIEIKKPPLPPGYRNAWDDCGGAGASATERQRQIASGIKGMAKPTRFRRNAAQDCGKKKQARSLAVGGSSTTVTVMAAAEAAATRALFAALKPRAEKREPLKKFLPRCLEHTAELVATIDKEYTDVQLEANLLHQCQAEKEFPAAYEDGFHTHEACEDFAHSLAEARMEELRTGKTDGYEEFCTEFYEHTYKLDKKKKAPPKSGAGRTLATAASLLGALVAVAW